MDRSLRHDLKAHAKALWAALDSEPFDEQAAYRQLNGIFDLASKQLLALRPAEMLKQV